MSNITLYTTDENSTTGIREASFQEVLDAARLALAKRVRRGTGFTSPRVTADYLRVRLGTLDHEVFCVIYLTLCVPAVYVESLAGIAEIA
jgi:DNA repair protein RadC